MKADQEKTKEQLITEVVELRQRIRELETAQTNRKRVEETVHRERDRAQQYLDIVEVILAVLNNKGEIMLINKKGCKILGYEEGELIGKNWFDTCLPAPVRGSVWDVFQRLMVGEIEMVEYFENPVLTKSGEERIIVWHNTVLVDETGNIVGTLGSGEDITDRRRIEKALQESEERYRLLFNSGNDAIFVHRIQNNLPGNFIEVNEVACHRLGYTKEELLALSPKDIDAADSLTNVPKIMQKLFVEKHALFEQVHVTKGGQRIPVEINALLFELNEQPAICSIARDITERKRMEEELQKHREHLEKLVEERTTKLKSEITDRKRAEEQLQHYAVELQEANVELSQYAYIVSHDLRAPLRAIRNYAHFLREDLEETLEDEQKTYLDHLDHAVREAHALISDILELSRVGQHNIELETLEVGSFLHSLIASLELPHDVEIVMEDNWPTLDSEPVLFRQIFQNLMSNAVKFNTSLHKRVELGWRTVGEDRYEFFVRDNGIGLDPRHQEKIFRIFERLHTKEEFEGTGIGLAIVKKAVSKLAGSVHVVSTSGKGSTFFVTLPKISSNRQ